MREQLEQRVRELKAEQHRGQQMLAELEGREAELRQTDCASAALSRSWKKCSPPPQCATARRQ